VKDAEFQTLLVALPTMSQTQLREVRNRVRALISGASLGGTVIADAGTALPTDAADGTSNTIDWLLEGIYHELKRRGLLTDSGRFVPVKSISPEYPEHSRSVRKHLLEHAGRPLNQGQRLLLGRAVAGALANWQDIRNEPVGLKSMLRAVPFVPEALDRAFPGYVGSFLLGWLAQVRDQTIGDRVD